MPAVYSAALFPAFGGLMSDGGDFSDVYRQVGIYTGRILKGDKPANLPVVRPAWASHASISFVAR